MQLCFHVGVTFGADHVSLLYRAVNYVRALSVADGGVIATLYRPPPPCQERPVLCIISM